MYKKVKSAGFALVSLSLLSACSSDPAEQAAKEACECLQPIYDQMEQLAEAMRSGDSSALSGMQAGMEQATKSQACMVELQDKYPDIQEDAELQNRMTQRMNELCPQPSMFGQ